MFLYGTRKREADATPLGILPKIRQYFAIKGNAHLLRPPFHLGVIIGKRCDI
jgi:hypothetical protein